MRMFVIPYFALLLAFISCTTSSKLSKYVAIENVKKSDSNCIKRFTKNNQFLNGIYKNKIGKDYNVYAIYKNGYYKEVLNESNKFIWSKEVYNNNNELSEYISYYNQKNSKGNEYYQIQKYDSVRTIFINNMPINSVFYFNGKSYKATYNFEPQKLKIDTNIEGFKIFNSNDIFSAIPSFFFFSKCHNDLFISNQNDIYKKIFVDITILKTTKHQIFNLDEFLREANNYKDFYEYFETTE